MRIFDIRIDEVSLGEALHKVAVFLSEPGQKTIFTPNPEILVKAQKDPCFKEVLNRGDLNICDGRGIQLVSSKKIERIPGIDFMLTLCALAENQHRSVFLLGSGNDEVIKKTKEKLLIQFPELEIVGYDKGPVIIETDKKNKQSHSKMMLQIDPKDQQKLIDSIKFVQPDILFVAFGMGKQEKWIDENLSKLPSVKIAMGVGGSFDYISGNVKRAPFWMQKIGLEWLYRLGQEPKRLGRIMRATMFFMFLVGKSKIQSLV